MAKKTTKKSSKKAAKKKAAKPAKKAVKKAAKKAAKKPAKKAVKKASAKKAAPKAEKRVNSVNPYINFRGNCEEAFNFYRSVFGGSFSYVGRFSDMPPMEGQPLPADDANKIMHISLPISKETILMGSDVPESMKDKVSFGNSFGVSVNAASQTEADRLFNGLSAGGFVIMPIGKTFWGSYFGMFADKYGVNWMISFDENPM